MRSRWQFPKFCVGDRGGKGGGGLDRGYFVAAAAEDERRRADRLQHRPHIDLCDGVPQHQRHHRARRGALHSAVHLAETGYVGDRTEEGMGQCAFAPMVFDLLLKSSSPLGTDTPRIIGRLRGKPRQRSVQNQRANPFRIRCREENAHRSALGHTEERGAIRPGCIHHRVQVVHALIERRNTCDGIRQAGTALVPGDEPRPLRQLFEEGGERQVGVDQQVDIADPPRNPDQGGVAVAQHAVCEADVPIARVVHTPVDHMDIVHPSVGRTRPFRRADLSRRLRSQQIRGPVPRSGDAEIPL